MKLKITILTFVFILLAAATACFAQDTLIHGRKELIGHAASGKQLYRRYCVGCHGPAGDGNGENAIWIDPKPRDFTTAVFKCRSTPTGTLPTDQDLSDTIARGLDRVRVLVPEHSQRVFHHADDGRIVVDDQHRLHHAGGAGVNRGHLRSLPRGSAPAVWPRTAPDRRS